MCGAVQLGVDTWRLAREARRAPPQKPLVLFYGSQTGTAEGFAKQLAGEAKAHGFKGRLADLEAFTPEALTSGMLGVFLMATYGEGDPTDNAVDFHRWLMEEASGGLEGVQFTVFGLGNRQYEHYNKMGKDVDGRLEALGGTRVYKHGEGDDDGTMDEDWEEWKADLWGALQAAAGAHGSGAEDADGLPPLPELQYEVRLLGAGAPEGAVGGTVPAAATLSPAALKGVDKSNRAFFEAVRVPVLGNRQLRAAPSQGNGTVHVSLDISHTPLSYGTADNLGVLPTNATEGVLALAEWAGWDAGEWLHLQHKEDGPPLFPTPCTVGHALAHYVDLHGPLSKALVAALAHFAGKPSERSALAALLARDAKAAYAAAVTERQLSVVELLREYPSIRPPLGAFLQLVPPLQPRLYTIASSAAVQPDTIDIAVSVIDRAKPAGGDASTPRRLQGVASTHIACAGAGGGDGPDLTAMALGRERYVGEPLDTLPVVVRPSTFTLPADVSVPVLLIGPGTGIAPMRAFLQERAAQRAAGEEVGDTVLFFGCRRPEEDYIYADELAAWEGDGTLTALFTAFSRAQDAKVYVQHRIEEQGALVWRLLEAGAHVYVCGATNMGSDVAAAIRAVAVAHGGVPADGAGAWFDALHSDKRYISELWSA